jgi:hypothetical protein
MWQIHQIWLHMLAKKRPQLVQLVQIIFFLLDIEEGLMFF